MIENPEETIAFLQKLRNVVSSRRITQLDFHHENCEYTDLCASVLMDVILLTARRHWHWVKQRVLIQGTLPPVTNPLHKLLVNSGIVANLVRPTNVPSEITEGIHKFALVKGGRTSPLASARKEIVSSELAAFFTECMRTVGFQLKAEAQGKLISIVSEVLDNAELHGNADGRWYAIGYFNPNAEHAIHSSCHLVLFNFGDSIYQSLKKSGGPGVQESMSRLAARHHGPSSAGSAPKDRTPWTLFALQEGVSRLSHRPGEVGRGSGTVDLINFFDELSVGEQRLCIISGEAYILLDGTFRPRKDKEGYNVLAFNADNDLGQDPDQRFVKTLGVRFPGTMISLRFPFHSEHLEKLTVSTITASETLGEYKPLVVHYNGNKKT